MTAIAGRVNFRAPDRGEPFHESTASQARSLGAATFAAGEGGHLAVIGPPTGDRHDAMLVGEVRLDNRHEVETRLRMPDRGAGTSDADLLLRAWREFGEAALDWLRGDFAFALWEDAPGTLTLVRGALSGSQLFYHWDVGSVSFASTPRALLGIAGVAPSPDLESAARFVAGVPSPGDRTFYAGIRRLVHAEIAVASKSAIHRRRFWEPVRREPEPLSDEDHAFALRDCFDRAVAINLADHDGAVGAHLSSGRDSGAVATSAARALAASGERLLAFTAAPSRDFAGSGLADRLDDESALAAATAALYPNVTHEVVRSGGDPFDGLEALHALLPNPVGHLTNFPWSRDIDRAAAAAGVRRLLTGSLGNFTISAGGPANLPALLEEDGAAAWWRTAGALGHGPARYARLLNWTYGGRMSARMHRLARRLAGATVSQPPSLALLRGPYREQMRRIAMEEIADERPPRSPFAFRAAMIMGQDPTNAPAKLLHGLDVRDPTADREVVELCFALPARLLFGANGERRAFDRAFGSRLGWSGDARPRGYQGADWDRLFNPARVKDAFACCREHPLVRELLDMDRVDSLIESWPERWSDPSRMLHYRNDLLGALAVGHFAQVNF